MAGLSDASGGRSADWLKSKNPACKAVKREAEEACGQEAMVGEHARAA